MPIIIGSNKTTVSVVTGQTVYLPVYISISNICNNLILQAYSNIYFIAYLLLQHLQAFEISIKDGGFSSGLGMIQRH